MPIRFARTFIAASTLTLATAANAGVIDFEGFANGTDLASLSNIVIPGTSITYNVTVAGPNDKTALVFDTEDMVNPNDPDLFAPFFQVELGGTQETGVQMDPGNILVIGNNNGQIDDDPQGGTLAFEFSESVQFISVDLFDTGDSGANGVDVIIRDEFGIETVFNNLGGNLGDNQYQTFVINGFGNIASFTLEGSGGIDNLKFSVPEPGTLALVGLGLLAAGATRRRG